MRAAGCHLIPNYSRCRSSSWESVKDIFTMGGRFTLIRYDEDGGVHVGAAFYALLIASMALMTGVFLFVRAVLSGEY